MWDLVKGRCTFTAKLEVEAEAVEFSTEDGGTRYALLCGTRITLHGVQGEEGTRRSINSVVAGRHAALHVCAVQRHAAAIE
jgi:hypothetical protein